MLIRSKNVWYADGFRPADLVISEGKIEAVGTRGELEKICRGAEILDCGGALVTPGFADSHTHLVFAGERSEEFSMRLRGEPYMKIMERGGGIAV